MPQRIVQNAINRGNSSLTSTQLQQQNNQLRSRVQILERELSELKSIVSAINKSVAGLNAHTGKMPDNHGTNGDHDRRYVTRHELASGYPIRADPLYVGIWRWNGNGNLLELTYDREQGLVSPMDWEDPPVEEWEPDDFN